MARKKKIDYGLVWDAVLTIATILVICWLVYMVGYINGRRDLLPNGALDPAPQYTPQENTLTKPTSFGAQ
jgi:hypothetical protein